MATSARTASLLANRSGSPYSSSGRIKILAPQNNAIASIAKKTISGEIDVMVSRYNAGEVTNDDMKAFLEKARNSVGISDADKLEITNQIRDFDSRILKDKLELSYQSAPENSLQQYQAAQALTSYYNDRAAGMASGTPAQTTALQNATTWTQRGMDIKAGIAKEADQAYRYSQEQKINALPNNSPERAYEKAQMYKDLADRAAANGDQNDALKYQSYYQQQLTTAEEMATKQVASENKKQVTDFINTTINDYHDGKITGDQALANLMEADKFAADQNDYSTQNRINSLSMTINREIDKGVTYSSVNGLSVKGTGGGAGSGELYFNQDGSISYGGGTTGKKSVATSITGGKTSKASSKTTPPGQTVGGYGGSGDQPKTLAQMEIEYKNELSRLEESLNAGKAQQSDGTWIPFTGKDYTEGIAALAKIRQLQLQNITNGLQGILEANPKAKIGKTQVSTILEDTTKQLQSVTVEYNGINTGRFVLTVKSNDAGIPQYSFVPKGKEGDMVENKGIYYPKRTAGVSFNSEAEAKNYVKLNQTKDQKIGYLQSGNGTFVIVDSKNKPIEKQELDILDANGNVVTYESNDKYGWIPKPLGPKTTALRNQMISEYDAAIKSGNTYKSNLLNYSELLNRDPKNSIGTIMPISKDSIPVGQTMGQKAVNTFMKVTDPLVAANDEVTPAIAPQGAVISPNIVPGASANFTPNTGVVRSAPSSTTLQVATQPKSAVAQIVSKPVAIAAPPGASQNRVTNQAQIAANDKKIAANVAKATAPKPSIATQVKNTVSNTVNKIKGLFR